MFTGDPLKLALSALGFTFTGMITGNKVLMGLGFISLIFTLITTSIPEPSDPILSPIVESTILYVDDEFQVEYNILVEEGTGLLTIGGDIPLHFELIEGNNIQSYWIEDGNREIYFSYTMKCTKRGVYQIKSPVTRYASSI